MLRTTEIDLEKGADYARIFNHGNLIWRGSVEMREFSENQFTITGNPSINLLRTRFTGSAVIEAGAYLIFS